MAQQANIVWLRRDLQIADNAALARALRNGGKVQPVFVFDTDILARFDNKKDRRISFIANAIAKLSVDFKERGGELLVFHGSARNIIPRIGGNIFAGEDYEPAARARDKEVGQKVNLTLVKEHLVKAPNEVLKSDGMPFKVFTPYSKAWKMALKEEDVAIHNIGDAGAYANIEVPHDIKRIDASDAKKICAQIGYEYIEDDIWKVEDAGKVLDKFAKSKLHSYSKTRDFPAIRGTSQISPYLRFGLITIRQAYKAGHTDPTWLNELIWREFYAMILFHFPESAEYEFTHKYRGLKWRHDKADFKKWCEGKTGFPIVDAGMRQLLETGWMHNRVRMIVASFLTKDLLIDWRWGEEHFAQYLMDYEQASNVGGWQWASSTGTDAAPYFRVFNPLLQSKKFDADGEYIKKYIPELKSAEIADVHEPSPITRPENYPGQMVDHSSAKSKVLSLFKGL